MLSQEDLRAISVVFKEQFKEQFKEGIKGVEERLDNLESEVKTIRIDVLENSVLPRLDSLEENVKIIRVDNLENNVLPRLDSLEENVKIIRVDNLENNALPRLRTIEQCYLDTSKRYIEKSEKFDAAIADIEVMKLAIQKNSADIKELQLKQA